MQTHLQKFRFVPYSQWYLICLISNDCRISLVLASFGRCQFLVPYAWKCLGGHYLFISLLLYIFFSFLHLTIVFIFGLPYVEAIDHSAAVGRYATIIKAQNRILHNSLITAISQTTYLYPFQYFSIAKHISDDIQLEKMSPLLFSNHIWINNRLS